MCVASSSFNTFQIKYGDFHQKNVLDQVPALDQVQAGRGGMQGHSAQD